MDEIEKDLYGEFTSFRKLPINFVETDRVLFAHELEKKIPDTVLFRLQNIQIDANGTIFRYGAELPDKFAIRNNIHYHKNLFNYCKFITKRIVLNKLKIIDNKCLWFIDSWSLGYFHWMFDALPRLFAVKGQLNDFLIILPEAYEKQEYITSSLKVMGVKNIRYIREGEFLFIRQLYSPSLTAPTGNYNDSLVSQMRDYFIDSLFNTTKMNFGDKIYISREKAARRKIVNEKEFINVIEKYGFQVLLFEEFTWLEQASIMLNAEFLISNHGAGLSNMTFMKQGCKVFELRKKGDFGNNCFFSLASALNIQYYYQVCSSMNVTDDPHAADLIVDCGKLKENLNLMMEIK